MKKVNTEINKLNQELKTEKLKYQIEAMRQQREFLNYSQSGASTTKIAFRNVYSSLDTTKDDIEDNKEILMARSRQLFMGNPISRGAILKIRTNVVGEGLKLKSKIKKNLLNLDNDEVEKIQKQIETIWDLWADSVECDFQGEDTFDFLQDLAMITYLMDGECFINLPYHQRKGELFDLKIQFLDSANCEAQESNDYLYEGVETDKNGVIIAYHFKDRHNEYTRIPVFDSTGRRQILKINEKERVNQLRGVPLLAPVLEILSQLSRFTNAELMNAVVSAMFTAFIKQDNNTGNTGKVLGVGEDKFKKPNGDQGKKYEGTELSMGYGNFGVLEPGQDLVFANPNRPNSSFEVFFNALLKQIGTALEIPFEVLLAAFNASYSASRAALLEVWKMYRRRRKWLAKKFCQPVFEQVIEEAVLKGYIDLPGFLENPIAKKAYLGAVWYGNSPGQIDPVKEVTASVVKINNGLSTREREATELNGSDWNENLDQLAIENKKKKEVGLDGNINPSKKE